MGPVLSFNDETYLERMGAWLKQGGGKKARSKDEDKECVETVGGTLAQCHCLKQSCYENGGLKGWSSTGSVW